MPRIPDEVLDRIKAEVSLIAMAERSGVELKKVGHELMGRCPFHPDDTPSLSINPERNVFQCFGCAAAGTPIDWTMRERRLDFRQAVEVLVRDFFPGLADEVLAETPRQLTRRSRAPELPCPFDFEGSDQQLLNEYVDHCHALFKESGEAQEYVRKRGLDSSELVSRFRIGYQDRTLGLRLPETRAKGWSSTRGRFQKLGLIRESGHAHFVGSLVIPTVDLVGNVTGIYGRKTRDDLNKNHASPKHLYLAGPDADVFNEEAFVAGGEIILTEARIDALSFWRWGFRNVTACRGVHLSDALLSAFVRYGIGRCLIAFDRDEAGDAGAKKAAEKLLAAGITCLRVLFPKGMDVNEVTLKMQPAEKTLALFLRSAEWMGGGAPKGGVSLELPVAPLSAAEATSPGEAVATAARTTAAAADDPVATEEEITGAAEERTTEAPRVEAAPAASGLVKLTDHDAVFAFEDRRYRVHELTKGMSYGSMRVSLKAERTDPELFAPPSPICGWHMDTLDLCTHRARALFEKQAAHEMGVKEEVVRFDLGRVLSALEDLQEKRIAQALEPKTKLPVMTEDEQSEALALAKDPQLLSRILDGFEKVGIVGETVNALVLYLAAVSRKLERPLAVVIRSSSAAGKTSLMDAVLGFVPDEEQERYSALTENVLFYFEGKDFKHKILAIAEEQGAQRASYPLKLLQSDGQVTAASTGKDPATGRLDAKEYKVEGPLMLLLASTAPEMDEELLNRCLVLTVDESREQTRRIHELQREAETLEGFMRKSERTKLKKLHQNFQRLLRPLAVFNPFSRELTFLDDQTRTRRDHPKYLALIRSIALLHQHQREVHTCLDAEGKTVEYIEVQLSDIALANRLAGEVLGHSLHELPPQTRKLLVLLDEWVSDECEKSGVARCDFFFTRRQARGAIRWGDTQMKVHLARLQELEYLLAHRGGRGQSFVFELLYEGQGKDGARFAIGLIDEAKLGYDANRSAFLEGWSGLTAERSGLGRPPVGGRSGGSRGDETTPEASADAALHGLARVLAEKPQLPATSPNPSSKPSPRRNGHRLGINLLRFPPEKGKERRPERGPRALEPALA